MSNWISVESFIKPESMKSILVTDGKNVVYGYAVPDSDDGEDWQFKTNCTDGWMVIDYEITHWQPLAEPPEVE